MIFCLLYQLAFWPPNEPGSMVVVVVIETRALVWLALF